MIGTQVLDRLVVKPPLALRQDDVLISVYLLGCLSPVKLIVKSFSTWQHLPAGPYHIDSDTLVTLGKAKRDLGPLLTSLPSYLWGKWGEDAMTVDIHSAPKSGLKKFGALTNIWGRVPPAPL